MSCELAQLFAQGLGSIPAKAPGDFLLNRSFRLLHAFHPWVLVNRWGSYIGHLLFFFQKERKKTRFLYWTSFIFLQKKGKKKKIV